MKNHAPRRSSPLKLVSSFESLVQSVSGAFTEPTFCNLMVVMAGWVFASRRTITAMLVATGAHRGRSAGVRHYSTYHRLFSTARWSLDRLGLLVLAMIEPWLDHRQSILLTLDDTLSRKRGTKMFGTGMHHDPLMSSKKTAVMSWGHSWVVLCVAVRLPFAPERWFSLPILFRLYLNKKAAARHRLRYRSRPELAVELLKVACSARPHQRFHAVVDSAYGGESVLGHVPPNCDLTSRLAMNARLQGLPPARRPGTNGRPRKRGTPLPSPAEMLRTRAKRIRIDLYGRKNERMRVVSAVGCVFKVPGRQLRVVVVEPLTGGRPDQAFFSTSVDDDAIEVLTRYAARWSIEEMNQAAKSHLGFEQPQGWTRKAVERTAPLAMLLYTFIVLWFAAVGRRAFRLPKRAWYPGKRLPSFADMLQALRRESLRSWVSAHLPDLRVRNNLLPLLLPAAFGHG